jgi:hypothetical protein
MITTLLTTYLAQTDIGPVDCSDVSAYCPDDPANAAATLEQIITNIIGFLTIVGGLAFFIYFVIGAITWITSGGDAGNVDKAKKMMTSAAIGMIIIAASWAIAWIMGKVLGVDFLNPSQLPLFGGGGGDTPIPTSAPPLPTPN